jgi:hypothetical protein
MRNAPGCGSVYIENGNAARRRADMCLAPVRNYLRIRDSREKEKLYANTCLKNTDNLDKQLSENLNCVFIF